MTLISNSNKLIAKNTIFLYFRMFIMMLIALFTSRIVLDVLGATDYGLNNVIGGCVTLFSFLNTALLSATQRFLNYHLGRKDYVQANVVFCMSLNTYILLSIVVFILGEIIGVWFIETQLNIPPERMLAAKWVFHFSLFQFVINLLRVPYNASIVAYERMNFYAYISLFEAIMKLLVAYFLYVSTYDRLILYAFLYMVVTLLTLFVYKIYCNRNFEITSYKLFWNKRAFEKIFSFSGWSLFGSVANLAAQQGISILINIFYGVNVNAAAGIAGQVSANVFGFITNFQTAFQPQIVKNYAAKEIERFNKLIILSSKFSYFLLFIFVLPILFTVDGLLDVWLKDVPEYTAVFCRLILIFLCIEAVSAPLWMAVQATGNIRNYQLFIAGLIFFNFPLSFLLLKLNFPVYVVWVVRIFVNIIVLVFRCIYIKRMLNFPLNIYIYKVLGPISLVTIIAMPVPFLLFFVIEGFWRNLLIVGGVTFVVAIIDVYFVGLEQRERDVLHDVVFKKNVR